MARAPFGPMQGGTVSISASTTSADEAIAVGQHQLHVANPTSAVAFVRTGRGATAATAADFPVLPGTDRIISIQPSHDMAAVILSAGTGTVYVTPGTGGI